MSETLEAPVQTQEQPATETQVAFNPFKQESWTTDTVIPETKAFSINGNPPVETPVVTPPAEEVVTPPTAEEIFDENVYVKNKYGWETPDAGLKELEDLRKFKEKPFDFTNEDSRKAFEYLKEGKEEELYNVLDQKRKINKLLSAEKIDEAIADQMIKMGMQARYKDLSPDEIEYKFKKQFSVPQKPVQIDRDTDEEYAQKVSNWEAAVSDVRTEKIIEAKVARPELEKLKLELVLPDIKRNEALSNEPSAEVLAEAQKARDKFLTTLNGGFKNFKGYDTKVKDGLVEIPVSFVVPEEEKVAQRAKIEGIEDIVQYFNQRWFDVNQNLNAEKIMADLYLLENPEKVFQGIANNAASQRMLESIKASSNINLRNNGSDAPPTTQTIEANGNSIDEQIKGLWAQKY